MPAKHPQDFCLEYLFQGDLPVDSFRGSHQVEKQPGRCCHSQREAKRQSSLLLAGRDTDRTTALIPTDGGEQYLQQHTAAAHSSAEPPRGRGELLSAGAERSDRLRTVAWGTLKGDRQCRQQA